MAWVDKSTSTRNHEGKPHSGNKSLFLKLNSYAGFILLNVDGHQLPWLGTLEGTTTLMDIGNHFYPALPQGVFSVISTWIHPIQPVLKISTLCWKTSDQYRMSISISKSSINPASILNIVTSDYNYMIILRHTYGFLLQNDSDIYFCILQQKWEQYEESRLTQWRA